MIVMLMGYTASSNLFDIEAQGFLCLFEVYTTFQDQSL
jgi:hypothetical protein